MNEYRFEPRTVFGVKGGSRGKHRLLLFPTSPNHLSHHSKLRVEQRLDSAYLYPNLNAFRKKEQYYDVQSHLPAQFQSQLKAAMDPRSGMLCQIHKTKKMLDYLAE